MLKLGYEDMFLECEWTKGDPNEGNAARFYRERVAGHPMLARDESEAGAGRG